MINACRSLLLNQDGRSYRRDFPGEEVIPSDYRPRQLPRPVTTALQVLYGLTPDRLYMNLRVRQMLSLLHTTELESHVLALDPRVTYWPPTDAGFFDQIFKTKVTQITGVPAELFISGEHVANDQLGHCQESWRLDMLDAGTLSIRRLRPPLTTTVSDITFTRDLSDPIPLPGSGLRVSFREAAIPSGWEIHSNARPQEDIAFRLFRMAAVSGDGLLSLLFANMEEPVATFRRLWETHHLLAYKYGGLVLALAYFINTLPQVPDA